MQDKILMLGSWVILIFIILVSLLTVGCAGKTEIVYISVPCEVNIPNKPINESSAYLNTLNILAYAEQLELTLKACKQ